MSNANECHLLACGDKYSGWSFRNLDLFFSASLLWGAISPKRLFGQGSIYYFLPYCFLIGVFIPIPFYVMYRHYPPFGAMCKGDSWFFFLPMCTCPTAAAEPATTGEEVVDEQIRMQDIGTGGLGGEGAAGPESAESNMAKNLEAGHAARCWPFVHRRRGAGSAGVEQDKVMTDKSTDSTTTTPQYSPTSGSVPPTPPPHKYYGHPESVWNNRIRRVPWHLINTPLICVGASFVPQAPASFVTSAGVVAFVFAFLVLRFRHEWWRRYTFVLAAALDAGTQICNMAIFVVFSLILKGAVEFPGWLGNDAANPEKCGVGDGYN